MGGTRVTLRERVPDLALAKLLGLRAGEQRLGGLVTTYETVVAEGARSPSSSPPAGRWPWRGRPR
jgi:hypothetical protein